MSVFDFFIKTGLAASELRGWLVLAAKASPDAAPKIEEQIAKLDAATTPEMLASFAQTAVGELANIGQGKFDGRDSPSNAA